MIEKTQMHIEILRELLIEDANRLSEEFAKLANNLAQGVLSSSDVPVQWVDYLDREWIKLSVLKDQLKILKSLRGKQGGDKT